MLSPDRVLLRFIDGREMRVPWLDTTYGVECSAIFVSRMPATFEERVWFWEVLPTRLIPGASIRLVSRV